MIEAFAIVAGGAVVLGGMFVDEAQKPSGGNQKRSKSGLPKPGGFA